MKKTMFRKVSLAMLALTAAVMVSLTVPDGGHEALAKKGPKLSKTSASLKAGKTMSLKVSGASKKVKWSTSSKSIVSIISTSGKNKEKAVLAGLKGGKATITAKVGSKKLKAKISVPKPKHVHSYTIPATCTTPATCSCGKTFGLPFGHNMSAATCVSPATCARCGYVEGTTIPHYYENTSHMCLMCGQLDLRAFLDFQIYYTTGGGTINNSWVDLRINNVGVPLFHITGYGNTAYAYPTGTEPAPIPLYWVLPSDNSRIVSADIGYDFNYQTYRLHTLNAAIQFSFMLEGKLQFEAQYGADKYLFTVFMKENTTRWTFDFVKL